MPRLLLSTVSVWAVLCIPCLVCAGDSGETTDGKTVEDLLLEGEYKKVERQVKKALKKDGENLQLLGYYEAALNGQGKGKKKKAKKVHAAIRKLWEAGEVRASAGGEMWIRFIEHTDTHHIIAYDYFQPKQPSPGGITTYYKIALLPKEGGPKRTFYLEMSSIPIPGRKINKYHVLREMFAGGSGGAQIIPYHDGEKPTLEKVLEDFLAWLEPKNDEKSTPAEPGKKG